MLINTTMQIMIVNCSNCYLSYNADNIERYGGLYLFKTITSWETPAVCVPLPEELTSSRGADLRYSPGAAPPFGETGKDAAPPGSEFAPHKFGSVAVVKPKTAVSAVAFQCRAQLRPVEETETPRRPSGIVQLVWQHTCSFSKTPWPGRCPSKTE